MQMADFKDKKRGGAAKNKGADDPDYENIAFTFRNHGQPKSSHLPPKNQVPAKPSPPSDSAQVPHELHKVFMGLYILLALIFLFCIILSALVLVKSSVRSQELLVMKQELWNISNSVRECQEEQKAIRRLVQQNRNVFESSVQRGDKKLSQLQTDITEIKSKVQNIQKISEMLEKLNSQPKSV
ncbi:mast cell-expressed membrane protein 1 [Dasypus novemcinctus]|uniref:mast cell-expressed membrane protein 1 n=1 Tax=Dasypus novemcinctus TaxID=9361 RepID=UPI00265DDE27|nr:mast cell-expressed membrane protein 1 [Dasypus novemcinctus]